MITVLAVNIGKAEVVGAKSGLSGINKCPQAGRIAIDRYGLVGDAIVDTDNHGGVDQAVYVYSDEDYDWFEAELERWFAPGTFGENLTIAGIESKAVAVGDRLIGGSGLVLEVTSPRIPCETFAAHMDDPGFPRRFMKANRTGFYCRVLTPGSIEEGEELTFVPWSGPRVPVSEMVEEYAGTKQLSAADIARFLDAPVHHKLRERLLKHR
jgi:MOSC domain-containing protein YiiM